jgi:hypothetical protein
MLENQRWKEMLENQGRKEMLENQGRKEMLQGQGSQKMPWKGSRKGSPQQTSCFQSRPSSQGCYLQEGRKKTQEIWRR